MKNPIFITKIKTATVRGKTWRVIWKRPRGKTDNPNGDAGSCEAATLRSKRMFIAVDREDPVEFVGTIIHETSHAAFPDVEEPVIQQFEDDLLRLFRRMGMQITFKEK